MAKFTQFLTKKIVFIALATVIAVGGIIWAIVANLQPKFRSQIDAVKEAEIKMVTGNGTSSVMVNDYLYFVGDSVSTASIQYGDNNYYAHGKVQDAGIYRVKIENDQPVVNYEYNNKYLDGDEEKEYTADDRDNYNKMDNCTAITDWDKIGKRNNGIQAVVPKIAGHDNTAMWVYGNNLIYVTPCNLRNSNGGLMRDYLEFYRVDLNGKKHQLIYRASAKNLTTENFTVWANGANNIYILVAEADDDGTYTMKKINVKTKQVTVIDEAVTKYVFPHTDYYRENSTNETLTKLYGGVMSYVYYTKAWDEDHKSNKGNVMYRYQINQTDKKYAPEQISKDSNYEAGITYTPLAVTPYQYSAQFVFSTTEVRGSNEYPTKYCVVINEDNYQGADDFAKAVNRGVDLGLTSDNSINFYAHGFWTVDHALHRYLVVDGRIDISDITEYTNDVQNVLSFMNNNLYIQKSNSITVMDVDNKTSRSISLRNSNNNDTEDSDEESTESSNELIMPVAILAYTSGDEAGKIVVYVHDTNAIRLYAGNGVKYAYLKLKNV